MGVGVHLLFWMVSAVLSATMLDDCTWAGPVECTDLAPRCSSAHGVSVRSDRLCLSLDNVLSESECRALVSAAQSRHETAPPTGPHVPGVRSQFTVQDPALSDLVWRRITSFIPPELDGGTVVGLATGWRHARYWPGQSVMAHADFRHGSHDDERIASRISFTLYLNDAFDGGETNFVKGVKLDGSHGGVHYSNRPRTGSAIMFYQCAPEFSHTAEVVVNGLKSIMRSDVMYRFASATAADRGGVLV